MRIGDDRREGIDHVALVRTTTSMDMSRVHATWSQPDQRYLHSQCVTGRVPTEVCCAIRHMLQGCTPTDGRDCRNARYCGCACRYRGRSTLADITGGEEQYSHDTEQSKWVGFSLDKIPGNHNISFRILTSGRNGSHDSIYSENDVGLHFSAMDIAF